MTSELASRGPSRREFAALASSATLAANLSIPGWAQVPKEGADAPTGLSMRAAAAALLVGLRPEARSKISYAFDGPERHRWTYVPGSRAGVTLDDMEPDERKLAMNLLAASLSRTGYEKATGVMKLAAVLKETRGFGRGQGAYAFAVFGKLEPDSLWGWRIEGHHLSLNFTSFGDRVISATPHCVCADPMEVTLGLHAGLAPIEREDYIGRDLVRNLDSGQLARTLRTGDVPNDVRAGPHRAENATESGGIAFAELSNETQRHLMLGIAETYISNLPHDLAHAYMTRLEGAARDGLRFEWAGGFETSDLHYYRLHAPGLSIEFSTRERVSHVHTLWREPGNDFGRAALAAIGQTDLPPQSA
jgi:hypothetical protein